MVSNPIDGVTISAIKYIAQPCKLHILMSRFEYTRKALVNTPLMSMPVPSVKLQKQTRKAVSELNCHSIVSDISLSMDGARAQTHTRARAARVGLVPQCAVIPSKTSEQQSPMRQKGGKRRER